MTRKNSREIYSTHNDGKSIIAEIPIRTFKNKRYKYMTSISKDMYINKLDDIVNKCNNKNEQLKQQSLSTQTHILTLVKKLTIKILNLKLEIM